MNLTNKEWQSKLTPLQYKVLREKATEPRKKGKPNSCEVFPEGIYHCVGCQSALYTSSSRFECGCGWPAFESVLPKAVIELPDSDGDRTEVVCSCCLGHLGHIFTGEGLTSTNIRYCINECVLDFKPLTN